jgi:hypothetical protein
VQCDLLDIYGFIAISIGHHHSGEGYGDRASPVLANDLATRDESVLRCGSARVIDSRRNDHEEHGACTEKGSFWPEAGERGSIR